MKTIVKAGTVDIPAGVTISLKSRIVTVKGPRGEIVKDFKHLPIDLTMADEKTVKVERWFTSGKQGACIRTACSHIGNMIIGVAICLLLVLGVPARISMGCSGCTSALKRRHLELLGNERKAFTVPGAPRPVGRVYEEGYRLEGLDMLRCFKQ